MLTAEAVETREQLSQKAMAPLARPTLATHTSARQKQMQCTFRRRPLSTFVLLSIASLVTSCFSNEFSAAAQSTDLQLPEAIVPENFYAYEYSTNRELQGGRDQTSSIAPTPTPAPTPIQIFWRVKNTEEETVTYTRLSDIFFCMAIALGWTVWLVAANVNPLVKRFATEGILIKGHVLQATCDVAGGSVSMGIPRYYALIDYVVEGPAGYSMKVRKPFQTQHFLEVGFANVDILVLPDDPTSGVLQRDWEKDYQKAILQTESREIKKKLSLSLGATLVLVTVVGAALAINHLPEDRKMYGWLIIAVSLVLMWPLATAIHFVSRSLQAFVSDPNQFGCLQGQHAELLYDRRHSVCGAFDALHGLQLPAVSTAANTPLVTRQSSRGSVAGSVSSIVEPRNPSPIQHTDSYYVSMPTGSTNNVGDIISTSSLSTLSTQADKNVNQDQIEGVGLELCGLSSDTCEKYG